MPEDVSVLGPVGRSKVVVAGASGFVGRVLLENLARDFDVIALARSARARMDGDPVIWRACDLFHLGETEEALAGADAAFYLVHSMMPTSRLTQGSFDDMDLICADNFARAARTCGIGHIVYLGGLLHGDDDELSRHLESRLVRRVGHDAASRHDRRRRRLLVPPHDAAREATAGDGRASLDALAQPGHRAR
jgi:hypothetical protein